ncbi:hypothetical protein NDU88_005232 [Pleurodeles waltl]|uniref:Uncharacterized protein n=1 Tax=Pleurodeles waltl TaxID=8319 RepID=A0AAV7TTF6_PLEWA|nr:hypothetical protein NDU88_005232 [Pleurodeles waltl]
MDDLGLQDPYPGGTIKRVKSVHIKTHTDVLESEERGGRDLRREETETRGDGDPRREGRVDGDLTREDRGEES